MTGRRFRWALAGGLLGALACLAAPGASVANQFFQQQTGQPCGACHLPNREMEGANGLNPTGRAFMDCGERRDCFKPVHDRPSTRQKAGIAEFTADVCGQRARYLNFRMGGVNPVGIIVRPGNSVLVVVSRNTTFAYACGAFPHADANFDFVPLD